MSNNLITSWLVAKEQLAAAQAAERALRDSIMQSYHDASIEAGTENYPVNGGTLKIVNTLEYKPIDPENNTPRNPKKDLQKAWTKMLNAFVAAADEMGMPGNFLAGKLVKWEPKLSVKEYKELSDNLRKIVDTVLETKPESPKVSWEKDADT